MNQLLILYVIALISCTGLHCPAVQQALVSGSKSPLLISVCLVCTTDVNKLGSWSSYACVSLFLLTPSSHLRSMLFLDIEMISFYLWSSPVCVIDLVTWQALQVDLYPLASVLDTYTIVLDLCPLSSVWELCPMSTVTELCPL